MNKYQEKSLKSIERFLKEDEEYILNETRPIKESSIKRLESAIFNKKQESKEIFRN
jgi:hypothetical protein